MTTKEYQRKSPLRIFLSYFAPHKKLFSVDVLCSMLIAGVDLLFPLVTRSALYEMLPNNLFHLFFTVMAAMVGCYLIRAFLNYIVCYYGHTFGIRVEADIRSDLFRHMQELNYDFYDRNRTPQLMSRLTADLFELTELAHHGPEDVITAGLTILGALVVMGTIQWRLALVVGLLIPVFLIVIFSMRNSMGQASVSVKEKVGHINQEIESSLTGIRTANGFAGLNRFVELMRTEPTLQEKPQAPDLENVQGAISVRDVSFTYDGDLAVLKNVNLEIAPGETIDIVGPSGGGKTTLCQLIPRFYEVTQGSILIDGQDVRDVTQKSIHQNIGIVQQDVFLFADTILENIRYGKPDATEEEVIEAAKKAEIYEDILAMPKGFQTYVGERGTLLSGGQKQRVAIARIFLKNPPILILDEATSALDTVTESKIQRAFDTLAKGRTTLIIAHRLSTIRTASRIVSISDGEITECGTHEELLEKGGVYADLYTTQTRIG